MGPSCCRAILLQVYALNFLLPHCTAPCQRGEGSTTARAPAVVTSTFSWELFCTNCLRSPVLTSWVVLATNRQRSQLGLSDLTQQALGGLLQLSARQSRAWARTQSFSGWQEHWGLQMLFLTAVCYPPHLIVMPLSPVLSICLAYLPAFSFQTWSATETGVVLLDLWCRGSFRYTGKHQVKRGDGRFKPSKRKHFLGNMWFKLWYALLSGHCGI